MSFMDRGYWPSYTIPSGLSTTNQQLFNELQAVLLRVRDANEPDILFAFPRFSSDIIGIHHLLAANMLTGKTTPVEDEARLTAAVEKFVADQRLVSVPLQQYIRQEKMRTMARINDVENAYKEFVTKTRSRVQNPKPCMLALPSPKIALLVYTSLGNWQIF
jgi:hypothetical protein